MFLHEHEDYVYFDPAFTVLGKKNSPTSTLFIPLGVVAVKTTEHSWLLKETVFASCFLRVTLLYCYSETTQWRHTHTHSHTGKSNSLLQQVDPAAAVIMS